MDPIENRSGSAVEDSQELEFRNDVELRRLCRIAARICDAPIAGVSWIGGEEQWFRCSHGGGDERFPRSEAPCVDVIERGEAIEIPDFMNHPRWAHSLLAARGVRAYFGFPMTTASGQTLGSFCLLDTKARGLTPLQREMMEELCASVIARVESALARAGHSHDWQDRERLARVGFLAGGLVHEVSGPLTALLHRASAARMSFQEGRDDVGSQLERQELLLQRIFKIISTLRGIAESQDPMQIEILDVARVVEEWRSGHIEDFQRFRMGFYFQVPHGLKFLGNAVMIAQIFENLFRNATRAMDGIEHPWIEISAGLAETPGFVEIRFRDAGPQLTPELREFLDGSAPAPTFKGGVGPTRKNTGLGLGLTLCRRFAENMGGQLRLTRESEHTEFRLQLPLAPA